MSAEPRSKYCCPTCGHPVLPTDPLAILWPMERAIFNVVYKAGIAGINSEAVAERIYQNGKDGQDNRVTVRTTINHMNKKLRLLGMEIRSTLGHNAVYRVQRWRSSDTNGFTCASSS